MNPMPNNAFERAVVRHRRRAASAPGLLCARGAQLRASSGRSTRALDRLPWVHVVCWRSCLG